LQAYCVQVTDNAAHLTICVACDFKTCVAYDFTRDLCIDLSNPCPNGTVAGLLDVVITRQSTASEPVNTIATWPANQNAPKSLWDLSSFVRTVRGEGGVNGCATPILYTKRTADADVHHDSKETESMEAMTEEELIDLEMRSTMHNVEQDESKKRYNQVYVGSANAGHFTVLRLPGYDVTVFEQNVRVTRPVDCNGTSLLSCSPSAPPSIGYLNCLCWNTTCKKRRILLLNSSFRKILLRILCKKALVFANFFLKMFFARYR
jgi:hypothetical protein